MNLNKHDAQTEMKMNMTPMIEVVFLLIIFFMIITDLTQQELEDLQLPVAVQADPDKPNPKEWRPILNIDHNGEMEVSRKIMYNPEQDDGFRDMANWLKFVSEKMERKFDETAQRELPDEPLLIRADENTPFKFVQKVMEICGGQDISIWKLQLAAKEPEKKDGQQ